MSHIRVMFIGHGPSNLPVDRVINVFHFIGPGLYAADQPNAELAVAGFYNTGTGQSTTIGSWLSPWVQRSAEMRSYDLDTVPPRVPTVAPLGLGATAGNGYAEEVAMCLSYRGALPSTARRRGRIYIGPLKESAIEAAHAGSPAAPVTALVTDLTVAATRLANDLSVDWAVHSTVPTSNFVPIVAGWVDNALDTQRRRGPDATTRQLWTTSVGI